MYLTFRQNDALLCGCLENSEEQWTDQCIQNEHKVKTLEFERMKRENIFCAVCGIITAGRVFRVRNSRQFLADLADVNKILNLNVNRFSHS